MYTQGYAFVGMECVSNCNHVVYWYSAESDSESCIYFNVVYNFPLFLIRIKLQQNTCCV